MMTSESPLLYHAEADHRSRFHSIPDFLRSISFLSDEDSDFEELPDFTEENPDGAVDLFDYPDESSQPKCKEIPFTAIHTAPTPFTTIRQNCWIPKTAVGIKITEAERNDAHIKIFNPNLYTIQVTHGDFQWVVRRRYKHFYNLHQSLRIFRVKHKLPMPSKAHKERRQSIRGTRKVPRFPKKPDLLVRTEKDLDKRKRHLEEYLQALVNISVYRNHMETLKFLEVSHMSFVKKLGKKWKEGAIMKCSGGRHISIGCCGCLKKFHFAGRWNKRWLFIKDTFIAYVRPRDGVICDVMLMDSEFNVQNGFGLTGAKHGLQISNLKRNLLAKCWTGRKADEWQAAIEEAAATTGKDYIQHNRFGSFAPVRDNSYAKWFVDGDSYFFAVANALENAQEEIFITDWWLSPEIYMKRPVTEGNRWRLDVILERKAKSGVKIFILLYKEMSIALTLKSIYSKHTLVSKCPENIKVLRHPDHGAGGVLLWAHHEKLVAIDQKVAFLGGFDLCYGRWDNANHQLTDLGCIVYDGKNNSLEKEDSEEVFEDPGIHSMKPVLKPSDTFQPIDAEGITLNLTPPSPKHDHTKVPQDLDVIEEECVCERNRANSNHSYDNESLESDFAKHSQNSAKNQKSMSQVVTVTVHQNGISFPHNSPNENHDSLATNESTAVNNEMTTSSNITNVGSSHVTEEESSVQRKPTLQRMESTTDHVIAYLERHSSDESILNTHDKAVKTDLDIYSMSAKDARESIVKRSLKVKSDQSEGENNYENKKKSINEENDSSHDRDKSNCVNDADSGEVQLRRFQKLSRQDQIVESSTESLVSTKPVIIESKEASGDNAEQSEKTEKRESWAMRKLRRTFSHGEHNNNINVEKSETTEQAPRSPTAAQHRWKLVLNVQKFQSAVKQQQEQTPFPASKKPVTPKLSKFFHLKEEGHRDSFSEMKDSLEMPGVLHRTKSEMAIEELGLKGSSKLWIGKDYVNFIHKDFVDLQSPFEDFIDRSTTPRMPWHDIGAVVYGKTARDVSRHFIGRWNFVKTEKCKTNKDYPLLLPKAHSQHSAVPPIIRESCEEVKTQILRSIGGWSGGLSTTERSIQTAYIHCIESAKHFIYIENQFFITRVGEKSVIKNEIGDALYKRILRAHINGEVFRVYVVMPLLPAFEGEIGNGGYAIQAVTHYNYTSISKGPNSLWERLSKEVIDPLKYIVFCGLRKHAELSSKPVSELLYVHSKLLIVDDDTAIIGSANINDRSMMGDRDSEMAVMVQDIHTFPVKFAGSTHNAGKFAASLRKNIFREHLGMNQYDTSVDDPVCDSFYKNIFLKQATINTTVFQNVFNCVPTDLILSYSDLERYTAEKTMADTDPVKARNELKKIKGSIVLLPLHFMENESSIIPTMGKETFLPYTVWT